MATAAQHLTVGGLLNFDFLLAQATSSLQIISISATLFAHYTLRSIQRPNSPPQYATKKTRLFIIDANNPPCSDDTQILVKSPSGQVTPPHTSNALPSTHQCGSQGCSDPVCQGQGPSSKEKHKKSSALPLDTPLQNIEAGGSYQVRASIPAPLSFSLRETDATNNHSSHILQGFLTTTSSARLLCKERRHQ